MEAVPPVRSSLSGTLLVVVKLSALVRGGGVGGWGPGGRGPKLLLDAAGETRWLPPSWSNPVAFRSPTLKPQSRRIFSRGSLPWVKR